MQVCANSGVVLIHCYEFFNSTDSITRIAVSHQCEYTLQQVILLALPFGSFE